LELVGFGGRVGRCVGCGGSFSPVQGGGREFFCGSCAAGLWFPRGRRCPRCGEERSGSERDCLRCLTDPPPFGRLVFVGPYAGLLRRLIRRFKFRGERFLARPLGELLVAAVRELDSPRLLVPLPGSYRGFWERGFDPALLLARHLALRRGWEVGRIIRRPLLDPPRRGESWEERMRGALRLRSGDLPPGVKRVLLVDDVYTSGATARQAAQLLLGRGAEEVEVAVLARR